MDSGGSNHCAQAPYLDRALDETAGSPQTTSAAASGEVHDIVPIHLADGTPVGHYGAFFVRDHPMASGRNGSDEADPITDTPVIYYGTLSIEDPHDHAQPSRVGKKKRCACLPRETNAMCKHAATVVIASTLFSYLITTALFGDPMAYLWLAYRTETASCTVIDQRVLDTRVYESTDVLSVHKLPALVVRMQGGTAQQRSFGTLPVGATDPSETASSVDETLALLRLLRDESWINANALDVYFAYYERNTSHACYYDRANAPPYGTAAMYPSIASKWAAIISFLVMILLLVMVYYALAPFMGDRIARSLWNHW